MRSFDFSLPRPQGMQGLFIIWLGQVVSGVAASVTSVALPIWIFSITGSGTAVGLLEFFFFGSYLIFTLFAGVLIDRYSRRMMMLVYDFLSLSTITVLLVIQSAGLLQVWHLYAASVIQGIGFAFQSPSYSAAIASMVPKKQYIRANGLMALLNDGPEIFGPLLAGSLYLVVGLNGILALNVLALVLSIGALLFVDIPDRPRSNHPETSPRRFMIQTLYGIRYIFRRPGLLGLQTIFFMGNLFSGIALSTAALFPMLLLRTGNDTQVVGIIQSVGALVAVLSGIFLTAWGGIKRPVNAILLGWLLSSLFGLTFLSIGQVFVFWVIGIVINYIFDPVVNVSMDAFLQTKIPPDVQGRVFSASDFLSQALIPFTPLLAGLFGDRIFEPAMQPGGSLAEIFGSLVGTGPGAGFALLILICGIGGTLIGLSGFLVKEIRQLDKELPDQASPPPVELVPRMNPMLLTEEVPYETQPESFTADPLPQDTESKDAPS
jgi:MFS family permease